MLRDIGQKLHDLQCVHGEPWAGKYCVRCMDDRLDPPRQGMNIDVGVNEATGEVILRIRADECVHGATMDPDEARRLAKSLWECATIGGAAQVHTLTVAKDEA